MRGGQVRRSPRDGHVYGADAKNTDLATLGNLGLVYRARQPGCAEAKYEEALEMERHVYGADAKNSLGNHVAEPWGCVQAARQPGWRGGQVRRSPRDEAARVRRRREEHGLGILI